MKRQRFKSDDDDDRALLSAAKAKFKAALPAVEFEQLAFSVEEGRLKLAGPQPILDKIARAVKLNDEAGS